MHQWAGSEPLEAHCDSKGPLSHVHGSSCFYVDSTASDWSLPLFPAHPNLAAECRATAAKTCFLEGARVGYLGILLPTRAA